MAYGPKFYRYSAQIGNDLVPVMSCSNRSVASAIRGLLKMYEAEPYKDKAKRVRVGVSECDEEGKGHEIFWAHGNGLEEAVSEALWMNKKSRSGGGR